MYYILENKVPIPCADVLEWGKWFESADRHVKDEKIGDIRISTVFLGIGDASLFETMIFGGPLDGEQDQCSSWEEAEKMHRDFYDRVKNTLKNVKENPIKHYILNSAVITAFGDYSYHPLTLDRAKEWLSCGFESTIGYPQTAEALTLLTGFPVAVNRKQIKMDVGDEALVFRLTCRLDNPALKGDVRDYTYNRAYGNHILSTEFVLKNYELGLLVRVK